MGDARREALGLAGVGTFQYAIKTGVANRDNPDLHAVGDDDPEILDADVVKLLHPEDRIRVRNALIDLRENGGSLKLECRALATDGTIHEYRVSAVADIDAGVIEGVVLDISAEKEAERELLSARGLLDDMLDSVPASVIVFDKHLVIQAINAEFATALDIDPSEFIGKSFFEAMPIGNGSEFELHYRKAVKTGQPVHFEFLFTPFQEWFEVSVVPVASGFISYTRSADDKKELEAIVREQEAQILQGEKMRVIGQLAGSIAHDFNNQLAAVLGYADLLRSQLDDDRLRRYADRIVSAADRASALSRRILSFDESEGPQSEEFDAEHLADAVVELMALTTPSPITIASSANGEALVHGDPSQVQAAVLNLVLNSRDAVGSDGKIHVDVATVDLPEPITGHGGDAVGPGRFVCIDVADTGPGMDSDTLTRSFDQFFSTKGAGRGFGLPSVAAVARSHHGIIRLTSSISEGTSAQLYLPLAGTSATSVTGSAPARASSSVAEVRSATVLVVEDNELVGGLALEGLTALGLDTIRATSGEDAILALMRHWDEIDLVYLDWVMPGMTGSDVLHQLKTLRPDLPVIIASGLMSARISTGDTLADGFLAKPFTLEQLRAAIAEAQQT